MTQANEASNSYSIAQLLHSKMAHGSSISDHITKRSYPLKFHLLKLVRATTKKEKNLWNKIVAKYHYLGYTGTVGRYMRYFICNSSYFSSFSESQDITEVFHEFIDSYTYKEIDELLGLEKFDGNKNHDFTNLPRSHLGVYLRFGWRFQTNSERTKKLETTDLFFPIVGCISAGSATYSCYPRDYLLGIYQLPRKERDRYLKYIANNWRFLILGKWPNLASHTLSKFSKILQKDWMKCYNNPLIAIETFVLKSRFEGSSYLANHWIRIGETKGYSKSGSITRKTISVYKHEEKKEIYLKLLYKFSSNSDPILSKVKKRNKYIMQKLGKGNTLDNIINNFQQNGF